ncbi:hypothetical protein [Trichococcus pasteurii]|uniref:3-keto-disaccharide hydrolase domain-containing protein n=1 Tax=Trichococcus pasteurii TaxID=43064 RepID=A0A1W1IHC8_9LACT|nr:hypothetical protein [Trichococcus pasteurii]SFE52494.1 hypothetical protein SAMN04488086_10552 [Trichococcus pasteurii]SLM52432.1 Hypothetical protein TPAS_2126 [Trichococcus pasteurii]SSB93313.1 Hypothetical protein TPAS_2126 [Trichococcus pasteurii]
MNIAMRAENFIAVNSFITNLDFDGTEVLRVIKDPKIKAFDEPTYARVIGTTFKNGTIEVKVLSRLLPDAPEFARGFLGIAFRIDENNEHFESLYIRPTNGRNENQLRRNRSTQYFSYPDYKFDRFRAESPGEYESYADMDLDEWIDLKVKVDGEHAELYVNNSKHPVLVVNDLKHGPDKEGAIGLWVEEGTEGFFKDLKVY